jgi:TatD DNase family protein
MRWFDTHCHLDVLDRGEAARARAAGVERILVPGVRGHDPAVAALAANTEGVTCTVGLHPLYLADVPDPDAALAAMATALRSDPRCVGVGEIGLDFLTGARDEAARERQRRALAAQIALAAEVGCPVIVHLRKGWDEFLTAAAAHPQLRWVMHMYSGAPDFARTLLRRLPRVWFGFGAPALRPGARKPVEVLRTVPRDRLLLETDAPDLAPPELGPPNRPAHLPWVGARLAALLDVSAEELAALTFENARRALDPDEG